MYRNKTKIAVLFLCFLLISCLGGVFYIDLGNHYAWVESREIVKIQKETASCLFYDVIIRPQVLNYADDDKYIIVYQVYDGSEYYDVSARQDKEEKDSLLAQFAKLKEIKYCYWIIRKQDAKVFGPMAESDFNRMCKELNVSVKMDKKYESQFLKTK